MDDWHYGNVWGLSTNGDNVKREVGSSAKLEIDEHEDLVRYIA